jgi:hypothetical protein
MSTTEITQVCPPDHKHSGTGTCYNSHGCRCAPCRQGRTDAARERHRAQAYGRWTSGLTDAEPAREHVRRLREFGIGVNRIAELAQFPMIQNLVYGVRQGESGRVPMKRISITKANRILAVRPTFDLIADGARVPALGTHRRLQALVHHGWSQLELSRRLHMATNEVNRILGEPHVTGRTHRSVAAFYDEMWDVMPPRDTPAQRTSYTKTRDLARRKGWHPALAWDDIDLDDAPALPERSDDTVDDTAVELALTGSRVSLTPAERRAAVKTLHSHGLTDVDIAKRLDCADRTVLRIRQELDLPSNDDVYNPHPAHTRAA